jgi:integral membrane protein (TIGR00529 family)
VTEIIKLLAVIVVIIFLIRKKRNLGHIILLASLLLGLLFGLNPKEIGINFFQAIIEPVTIRLIGVIVLVFLLSSILRRIESLKDIVDSLQKLVKDYRLILAFIPSFLGLLPMPAGAMFSAPMVKEIGDRAGLNPEEEIFVNYWFRHIWEFVWPLYPSIILLSALLGVEIREIILVQFPISLVALILGLIWEQRYLKKDGVSDKRGEFILNSKKLFLSTWPILLVIFLVIVIKLDLLISLILVILSLLLLNRSKIKIEVIIEIIKKDIPLNTVVLIAGIMIFKRILETTGVIMVIPGFFAELGIHPLVILFSLPFLIGMLTGVTSAIVGIGFPVLLSFIVVQGEANLNYAMFAFVGGYMGHLLSPMHLCLVVTSDYFKVDIGKIYKMLILPVIIIVLSALILVIART